MELDFTSDQDELRATVRTVLAAECSPASVRELVEAPVAGKTAAADALWGHMVELGWPALTVPEAAGGLGSARSSSRSWPRSWGGRSPPARCSRRSASSSRRSWRSASDEQQVRFLAPGRGRRARGHARDRRGDGQLRSRPR